MNLKDAFTLGMSECERNKPRYSVRHKVSTGGFVGVVSEQE